MNKYMTASLTLCLFLFSHTAFCSNAVAVKDYPFERVADNTWVIHGPLEMPNVDNQGFMNNPGIIITSKGIVVIDPGSSMQAGKMVLRMIRKVSNKPIVAIFNTHIHGDHWLGNQAIREAYPDVPIYGHNAMLAMISEGAGDTWVDLMDKLTEGATRGTIVVGPDHAVSHSDGIKIGDKTFRIHHYGQAHTLTDLMIEIEEDAVVFLGDNVTINRIPRMSDGNFAGNIDSVNKVLETNATVWVPGHGPTGNTASVETYRDYLQAVYAAAEAAFEDDLDSSDVKAISIKTTSRFKDWVGYNEELGPHGAQAYMEVEAAEF